MPAPAVSTFPAASVARNFTLAVIALSVNDPDHVAVPVAFDQFVPPFEEYWTSDTPEPLPSEPVPVRFTVPPPAYSAPSAGAVSVLEGACLSILTSTDFVVSALPTASWAAKRT